MPSWQPPPFVALVTYVARALPEETYESGEKTRTVVIEFESVEAGNLVYRSVHVRMLVAAGRLWACCSVAG